MSQIDFYFSEYYEAVFDTDRGRALEVVDKALEAGIKPEDIIFQVVVPSIDKMVTDFVDDHGATLSQHFICSKVSAEVADRLLPLFSSTDTQKGTVILGTSRGDFHGLGKKIVGGCLSANMFRVVDLGINVSPEQMVDAALTEGAGVIGVSSMMVHSARGEQGARGVRKILDEKGLSSRIKLVVGGAPYRFDSSLFREVGADAWAENAMEAVRVIADLMEVV